MVKVSAPGNVFLLGEHSVVYERPAIVAAINRRTYTEAVSSCNDKIIVSSVNYGKVEISVEEVLNFSSNYTNEMDPLVDILKLFGEKYGLRGTNLRIYSDIPRSSGGMSSSTAVLCSVLGALSKLHEIEIEPQNFFDLIYPIQVKIHGGKASGSEIVSSSLGGYNLVRIDKSSETPQLERENLAKRDFKIVIGDTGIEAKTKETVKYVRDGWEKDRTAYEKIFDRIKAIVEAGEEAIKDADIEGIGRLMNENHEILSRELGVSHPRLNELVDIARKEGAYGAKLSGGGKGGIVIALTSYTHQNAIASALKKAGANVISTEVGGEGIKYT